MKKNNNSKNKENEKALKKVKEEKISSRFLNTVKKKWLISKINTILLVVIAIAITVGINVAVKNADITPIDCTTSKDYSLTDESKERVSKIDKDVKIYFFNFEETSVEYELTKQYNKANSKIDVQLINTSENLELKEKYDIQDDYQTIVVESGEKFRTIMQYDLKSYDYTTGKSYDLTEQKVTSAIINVIAEEIPKVYFLTGYTDFEISTNMTSFAEYLKNEVLTYEDLNLLNKENIPEDCDTLVIMTPNKDFDDFVADEIIKYIENGGNILWFNGCYVEDKDFKNVNRILELYGINKFEKGIIVETDTSKIYNNYGTFFAPEVLDSSILKDVKSSYGTAFLEATRINVNTDGLEELKVEERDLLKTSGSAYFLSNLTGEMNGEEQGSFVVGAELIKTISEEKEADEENEAQKAVTSTLIIYGNDLFISDQRVAIQGGYQLPVVSLFNNPDVALNSVAYLTDNYEDITIRKSYSDSVTEFLPSQMQKNIIIAIIFAMPVIVVLIGLIIWIRRRRR